MRIAITGGSGSLGRTLIGKLANEGADKIVTFSRDEQKRLALASEFSWHPGVKVYAGDIRDASRLQGIFYGCEVVVHAAARKVVTGHHDEPREMLRTNVEGTLNVVEAAMAVGVKKVLFISSDKATAPINVYGVSKALAEHVVISENARTWSRGMRLSVIRYGNVLASSGSVVRVWRDLVASGRAPEISDARMTRFWLTLPQAADFVLRAVGDMRGGEVFLPVLKAAGISVLAEAVCPGVKMRSTGIRHGGEKLHEELVTTDEARRTIRRNGFFVVTPTQSADNWDATPWIGDRVPESFTYNSETWPDRLDSGALRTMLGLPVVVSKRRAG